MGMWVLDREILIWKDVMHGRVIQGRSIQCQDFWLLARCQQNRVFRGWNNKSGKARPSTWYIFPGKPDPQRRDATQGKKKRQQQHQPDSPDIIIHRAQPTPLVVRRLWTYREYRRGARVSRLPSPRLLLPSSFASPRNERRASKR